MACSKIQQSERCEPDHPVVFAYFSIPQTCKYCDQNIRDTGLAIQCLDCEDRDRPMLCITCYLYTHQKSDFKKHRSRIVQAHECMIHPASAPAHFPLHVLALLDNLSDNPPLCRYFLFPPFTGFRQQGPAPVHLRVHPLPYAAIPDPSGDVSRICLAVHPLLEEVQVSQ